MSFVIGRQSRHNHAAFLLVKPLPMGLVASHFPLETRTSKLLKEQSAFDSAHHASHDIVTFDQRSKMGEKKSLYMRKERHEKAHHLPLGFKVFFCLYGELPRSVKLICGELWAQSPKHPSQCSLRVLWIFSFHF